eukprot:1078150-Amorphochlora_amoeboformis.AAC.1
MGLTFAQKGNVDGSSGNNSRPWNAGNIGYRLPGLRELFHIIDCDIFIIDYRGYGNSSGSPSESGLVLDAKAALTYLTERAHVDKKYLIETSFCYANIVMRDVNCRNIIVFGRSLGGAVAIALAAKYPEKVGCEREGFEVRSDVTKF